jgi:hypothetical protein
MRRVVIRRALDRAGAGHRWRIHLACRLTGLLRTLAVLSDPVDEAGLISSWNRNLGTRIASQRFGDFGPKKFAVADIITADDIVPVLAAR